MLQYTGRQRVVPQIAFESEAFIGFNGIGAMILQFIRAKLIHQADPSPLLVFVDDQTSTFPGDFLQRNLELCPAVAAKAMEYIAGETLRVNPQKGWRISRYVAHPENNSLLDNLLQASFEAINSK